MPHRDDKVKEEMVQAAESRMLYLSHAALLKFPNAILTPSLEKIFRLDLSFNNIHILPKEIATLHNLKEFWINNNPIEEIPSCIDGCAKLEVFDIRRTRIQSLPPNIAMLKKLVELDWRNTPLEQRLLEDCGVKAGDINGLKGIYHTSHERDAQKELLKDFFTGVHFLKEADRPDIGSLIFNLVEVSDESVIYVLCAIELSCHLFHIYNRIFPPCSPISMIFGYLYEERTL